jgi:hypothetical protein
VAKHPKLRVGLTIAIGVVTLLVCAGIGLLYAGGEPDSNTTLIGYVAMGLGVVAALLLGVGLTLLVHYDRGNN